MPAEFDQDAVQTALAQRLAGATVGGHGIVWVKDGDEVVVWLDSLGVSLDPGIIRVSVDLETQQTRRGTQHVVIAVAEPSANPSLHAVSDETARGDGPLSARWGRTLQDAVWAALLQLAEGTPAGIAAGAGMLVVYAKEGG